MKISIIELNDNQVEEIENKLDTYDRNYITYKIDANINIGITINNKIVGGVNACMTAFKIMYISTLYIEEAFRRQGFGKLLMTELEKRAKEVGANMLRVDTFNWQGEEFYEHLGYEQVGYYSNEIDDFSEYFYVKRI